MSSNWSATVVLLCTFLLKVLTQEPAAYGAYTYRLEKASVCRGPKRVNLAHYWCEARRQKDRNLFAMNITLTADAKLEMLKAVTYRVTNKQRSMEYKYQSDKPCDHLIMGPFVRACFNTTTCVLKKGSYVAEIDIEAITKLTVPKWFYGLYQTKSTLYSRKGNIACIITEISFNPKDKATA